VVSVSASEVVDFRDAQAAASLGLSADDLASPVSDYEPCWRVARAAHQLGLHGIAVPAATRFGETLALFEEHLAADELPRLGQRRGVGDIARRSTPTARRRGRER